MIILDALSIEDFEQSRKWRNADISHLRTPYFLTKEMQEDFYNKIICNRLSNHRFWALVDNIDFILRSDLIGIIGLTNISFENRSAEISIIIDPNKRKQGIGKKGIELILEEGFNNLNLENIYGECYINSVYKNFWEKLCKEKNVELYRLPRRKYYKGQYHDSIYFNFTKEAL